MNQNNADFISGLVTGLTLGKKKWGDIFSEDWQPPADWPEVPEPGDYGINFWNPKDVWGNCGQAFIDVSRPEDDVSGIGEITVDWGDGTVETYGGLGKYWGGGSITHNYKENKMFVICAVCTSESCFVRQRRLYICKFCSW